MSHAKAVASKRWSVPDGVTSDRAKLVYFYLESRGVADLEEIAGDLDLPLMAVCDLLDTLEKRQLVRREADQYELIS